MITLHNASLLPHNTFSIDARCREFIEYETPDELYSLLPRLQGNERWLHIGGGSNLLFTTDFDGTILHSALLGCKQIKEDGEYIWLKVGAGENWDGFVGKCVANGIYGLENLSLIPGEVGASAVQNIGAYGVEVSQFITEVEVLEVSTGRIRTFSRGECQYAYRSSIFKHELKGNAIVAHVTFRLFRTFRPNLEYGAIRRELEARDIQPKELTADCLRKIIIEVRRAKLPDPAKIGSAGSFFMNPIVSHEKFTELLAIYPAMPHYPLPGNLVKIPAGWMIEQCGWKGRNMGRAGVYAKQALVLVNLGGAKGSDIMRLSETIQRDVFEKFGVEIQPEANFI